MSSEGLAEAFPATLAKEFYVLKSNVVSAQIGGHMFLLKGDS